MSDPATSPPPRLQTGPRRSDAPRAPALLATTPALWASAHLAAIDLAGRSESDVARRVAELAHALVPDAAGTSVVLVRRRRVDVVAFSGVVAAPLDERQFLPALGPAIATATGGWEIDIDDTALDERYPAFSRQAARAGIRRVLSVAVPVMHDASGALTLYGSGAPFGRRDRDVAQGFAAHAAATLSNALSYAAARDLADQLQQAMASRAVIEQAKGMIMADQRCSADEAFDVLRRTSAHSNRKLRDVATSLVEAQRR